MRFDLTTKTDDNHMNFGQGRRREDNSSRLADERCFDQNIKLVAVV